MLLLAFYFTLFYFDDFLGMNKILYWFCYCQRQTNTQQNALIQCRRGGYELRFHCLTDSLVGLRLSEHDVNILTIQPMISPEM